MSSTSSAPAAGGSAPPHACDRHSHSTQAASLSTSPTRRKAPPPQALFRRLLSSPDEDEKMFSPINRLVRSQIEIFEATEEDAERLVGRHIPSVGQVGIRCVHCARARARAVERGGGGGAGPSIIDIIKATKRNQLLSVRGTTRYSVSFPASIRLVYQNVRNFQRFHMADCPNIPAEVKAEYARLRRSATKSSNCSSVHWAAELKRMGLVDSTTTRGIRVGYRCRGDAAAGEEAEQSKKKKSGGVIPPPSTDGAAFDDDGALSTDPAPPPKKRRLLESNNLFARAAARFGAARLPASSPQQQTVDDSSSNSAAAANTAAQDSCKVGGGDVTSAMSATNTRGPTISADSTKKCPRGGQSSANSVSQEGLPEQRSLLSIRQNLQQQELKLQLQQEQLHKRAQQLEQIKKMQQLEQLKKLQAWHDQRQLSFLLQNVQQSEEMQKLQHQDGGELRKLPKREPEDQEIHQNPTPQQREPEVQEIRQKPTPQEQMTLASAPLALTPAISPPATIVAPDAAGAAHRLPLPSPPSPSTQGGRQSSAILDENSNNRCNNIPPGLLAGIHPQNFAFASGCAASADDGAVDAAPTAGVPLPDASVSAFDAMGGGTPAGARNQKPKSPSALARTAAKPEDEGRGDQQDDATATAAEDAALSTSTMPSPSGVGGDEEEPFLRECALLTQHQELLRRMKVRQERRHMRERELLRERQTLQEGFLARERQSLQERLVERRELEERLACARRAHALVAAAVAETEARLRQWDLEEERRMEMASRQLLEIEAEEEASPQHAMEE